MSGDAGVRLVGHVLRRLGEGACLTVDELGRECAVARSTAFDVVDRLERTGFVVRDNLGRIGPGASSIALGFAHFGLARLHGPAEAAMTWLRDQTGADPVLSCGDGPERRILVGFGSNNGSGKAQGHLSEPIRDRRGEHRATLTLMLGQDPAAWEIAHAQRCLQKVVLTLAHELDDSSRA